MNTSGTKIILIRSVLLVLLSLYFLVVFGQPSDLVSFNANRKAENIAIQWVLTPSNDFATIVIERKTKDTSFQSIAEFWVNLEGNNATNFTYTDKKVLAKNPHYRLKCIRRDGKVQFSEIVTSTTLQPKKSAAGNAAKSRQPKVISNSLLADTIGNNIQVEQLKYRLLVQLVEQQSKLL